MAQDGSGLSNVSDTPAEQSKVIVKKVEAGPNIPADEENHDTKDLEALFKRYNTDSKKVLEDNSKIPAGDEVLATEVKESEIEEMRPSEDPTKNATINAIKKVKEDLAKKSAEKEGETTDISRSVSIVLEPLQKLSEKELYKLIDDSTKNTAVRPYLEQFPNFTIFVVKLIKDKDSFPGLVKIVENRDRLIRFGGVMIATFIFGFILKRVMHREGRSFIKAAYYFLLRSWIMFAIRVYIVYYFFAPELTPAARVFKETFMKNM